VESAPVPLGDPSVLMAVRQDTLGPLPAEDGPVDQGKRMATQPGVLPPGAALELRAGERWIETPQ
jgi:hypothetical protein